MLLGSAQFDSARVSYSAPPFVSSLLRCSEIYFALTTSSLATYFHCIILLRELFLKHILQSVCRGIVFFVNLFIHYNNGGLTLACEHCFDAIPVERKVSGGKSRAHRF